MDKVEKIENSTVQHGDMSSRVYIMKLHRDDVDLVIEEAERLSEHNRYGKIVAKIPEDMCGKFSIRGFSLEALVPGFYNGVEGGAFMSKFLLQERGKLEDEEEIENIVEMAKEKAKDEGLCILEEGYEFRICEKEDSKEMAKLYKEVFETYPFPIFDYRYIEQTMDENIRYYGIWHKHKIVSLSSSEMDIKAENTEMTDFATHPKYRGKALSQFLLRSMEDDMAKAGIKTAYTIARARIAGINVVFGKGGYRYAGTLVKNTGIDGDIESMNIWHKPLDEHRD